MLNDAISKFFIMEYTVVLLYDWSIHGDDIKKMLHDNRLKWNSTKIKKLTTEELLNEFVRFKVDNDFKIDETIIGSSGIYETNDSNIIIKIIKPKSVDDTKNVDDILIVYKGIEERFYIQLMKKFRDIGCLMMKIVDDEIVFKNRINIKLINTLNDTVGEKNVKIRNFIEKTKTLAERNELYSDDFKSQWIKCIEN